MASGVGASGVPVLRIKTPSTTNILPCNASSEKPHAPFIANQTLAPDEKRLAPHGTSHMSRRKMTAYDVMGEHEGPRQAARCLFDELGDDPSSDLVKIEATLSSKPPLADKIAKIDRKRSASQLPQTRNLLLRR